MSNVIELSHPGGFSQPDMALLFRVLAELRRTYPAAVLETGAGDRGDPWATFTPHEDKDALFSAQRIDGMWIWLDAQGQRIAPPMVPAA
jgi:hypothetical protein